ncbi:antibiotic biosynthesis monooxygenase [Micromonospora sp. NPDC005161]
MSVITVTRFTIEPDTAAALRTRHADLVAAIRAATPGLVETRLGQVDEQTWIGIWRWDSAQRLQAAGRIAPELPETAATFSLARAVTADDVAVVDEH